MYRLVNVHVGDNDSEMTYVDIEGTKELDNVRTVGSIHVDLELTKQLPFILCIWCERNCLQHHDNIKIHCLMVLALSFHKRLDHCCTIPKTGVFAEEGPENHSPNCLWYAVWFGVWICRSTIPLCSEVWIGEEVLSLGHSIPQLFTWPSSPTTRFGNSFLASMAHCLFNTTN